MAVQMTRDQYEKVYGVKPTFSTSELDDSPTPIRMTREEYNATYGQAPFSQQPEQSLTDKIGRQGLTGEPAAPTDPNADISQLLQDNPLKKAAINLPGSVGFIATSLPTEQKGALSPANLLTPNSPLAFSKELLNIAGKAKDIFTGKTTAKQEAQKYFSTLKGEFQMWQDAGKDIYDSIVATAQSEQPGTDMGTYLLRTTIEDPALIPSLLWAPEAALGTRSSSIASRATAKLRQTAATRATAKIERELYDIENAYAATRKANQYLSDAGAASRARIAKTDVLVGAVDEEGILRTKGPGRAIERYKAQTVDGVEDVVRNNLIREAKTVHIDELSKALRLKIAESGLEGSDLVKAMNGLRKELEGLKLRADTVDAVPVYKIHDAKISTTRNINYLTDSTPTITFRKAKAAAYKELVEQKSDLNVKAVNQELGKYLKDIELLERLDGKRVRGGRLGKYFAQVSGNLIGGAAGNAVGGPLGMAVGTILGGEAASLVKGTAMSRTFGRPRGVTAPKNPILQEAAETAKKPPTKNLRVADKPVGAPKDVPKTKEVLKVEKQIRNNIKQQDAAIKAGDFTLVAALKEVYEALVDKLKSLVKAYRESPLGSEKGAIKNPFDQSNKSGKRNTQYTAIKPTTNQAIKSTVSQTTKKPTAQLPGAQTYEKEAKSFLKTNPNAKTLDAMDKMYEVLWREKPLPQGFTKKDLMKAGRDTLEKQGIKDIYNWTDQKLTRFVEAVQMEIKKRDDKWIGIKSSKPSTGTNTSTSNAPTETAAGSKPKTAISGGGKGVTYADGTPVPKELESLVQSAKGKTLDEFVKSRSLETDLQLVRQTDDAVENLAKLNRNKPDLVDEDGFITLYHGGKFKGDVLKASDDELFFLTDSLAEAEDYARLNKGNVVEIKTRPEFVSLNEGSGEFEISQNLVKVRDPNNLEEFFTPTPTKSQLTDLWKKVNSE